MRLGIRATWNGTADFSAAIRRAVFSGLSSIGVSLAEPSSVIRQVIKIENMALLCTRCGLIGADMRPDAFRQTGCVYRQLTRAKWRWPAPFAPRALPRFITTTKQSAPSRRIGTFSLAVVAACAFSLGIAV